MEYAEIDKMLSRAVGWRCYPRAAEVVEGIRCVVPQPKV
jgi:hypothetical protein